MTEVLQFAVLFWGLISHTEGVINVALKKPTQMSSEVSNLTASSNAVDGNLNTTYPYVILTTDGQPAAWWTVDLETDVVNATIMVYFRTDDKTHRNGMKVFVSPFPIFDRNMGRLCLHIQGQLDGSDIKHLVTARCPGTWRHVMVYTDEGDNPILDVAEFQVMSCPNGFYGTNCDKKCEYRRCLAPSPCDAESGECPWGCQAGFIGQDCSACKDGKYGVRCELSCTSRRCLLPSSCDAFTGTCIGGCIFRMYGKDCRQCQLGAYGVYCGNTCSRRHCAVPTPCNRDTTNCREKLCMPGWRGNECNLPCLDGTYGTNCLRKCIDRNCRYPSAMCNATFGHCIGGCIPGWISDDCMTKCPVGRFGLDCSLLCEDRHCKMMPSECLVDGACPGGCEQGWTLANCTQECPEGRFGLDCSLLCEDRHCKMMPSECPVDGACPGGCEQGWTLANCTQEKQEVESNSHMIAAMIGGVVTLAVTIVLILGLYVFLRRSGRLLGADKRSHLRSKNSGQTDFSEETNTISNVTFMTEADNIAAWISSVSQEGSAMTPSTNNNAVSTNSSTITSLSDNPYSRVQYKS